MRHPQPSIRDLLVRGISWTTLYRVIGVIAGFAASVFSARLLGVADYGFLQIVLSLTNVLAVFGGLGLARVVMQVSGEADQQDRWGELRGLLPFASAAAAAATLALGIAAASIWAVVDTTVGMTTILLALAIIVLRQPQQTLASALVGQGRIAASGAGEALRDAVIVAVLGAAFLTLAHGDTSPAVVMGVRLLGAALALALTVGVWRRIAASFPGRYRAAPRIRARRRWLTAGLPLIVIAAASILNTNADILMIGAMLGQSEVGIYHAATRGAQLVGFALLITIVPLAPVISRLYRSDPRRMFRVVRAATLVALAVGAVVAAVLVVFADEFLAVFGPEFVGAKSALLILVGFQLVNVAAGPVQNVLVMARLQSKAAIAIIAGTAVNIAANALLIPQYGLVGAAVGTGASIVIWNALSAWYAYRLVFRTRR